jgi:hypothetical protein
MYKQKDEESNPEDLKNFVDETTRIRLSEEDLKKLEEVLLNPPKTNEELKKAVDEYKRRGEILSEMIKNDQELGLYDEPFDNLLIKEAEEAFEKEMTSVAPFGERYDLDDEISDWDVTLMDGLEDEEPFFTEEEMDKILQEEPTEEEINENFSTIEPNIENIFQDDDFLTEAINEFNQESIEDGWDEEMEKRYWEEQVPESFATPEELTDEPVYQSEIKEIDEMLKIANEAIDENTSSDSDDEKKK